MNEAEQHLCRDCVCVVKMQRPKEAHTTGRSDVQRQSSARIWGQEQIIVSNASVYKLGVTRYNKKEKN